MKLPGYGYVLSFPVAILGLGGSHLLFFGSSSSSIAPVGFLVSFFLPPLNGILSVFVSMCICIRIYLSATNGVPVSIVSM